MDSEESKVQDEEEKKWQESINRRYNSIIRKWGDFPAHQKTILKLLPIFFILAIIPLTTRLSQTGQNLTGEAAKLCRGNNPSCKITTTPTVPTPTTIILNPSPTTTPSAGLKYTPTPTQSTR